MPLPTFLIIGAPKSGTTSLWRYLNQHPQIFMSAVKEPYFFVSDEEKEKRIAIGMKPTMTMADYLAHFATANGAKAMGEASVPYLYQPESPRLIHDAIPNVKLITLLRNPVDRAYSNYWFLRTMGLEKEETFEDAILSELAGEREDAISILLHIRKGLYTPQLQRYFDVFPRDQVRIYLQEELSEDPQRVLKDLWQFLEVDDSFVADTSARFNQTFAHSQSVLIHSRQLAKSLLKSIVRPGQTSNNWPGKRVKPQKMQPATRRKLLRIVEHDVMDLQDLLGVDLSHWLRTS